MNQNSSENKRPWWQHPALTRPGYWLVTALAAIYGTVLSLGRVRLRGGILICTRMPAWSFGRGGTQVGAVFLTRTQPSANVLAHEAVHREQWKRYGLVFPFLYFRAGLDPYRNRFEQEAGLLLGGYRRPHPRPNNPETPTPDANPPEEPPAAPAIHSHD